MSTSARMFRVFAASWKRSRASRLWDGAVVNLQVVETHPRSIKLRALVSARNAPQSWDLRCEVREKLLDFIRTEMPEALPRDRSFAPLPVADVAGDWADKARHSAAAGKTH